MCKVICEVSNRLSVNHEDVQRYLQDFDLDPLPLGKRIAGGRQHVIHLYNDSQVIKVPRRSLYMKVYGPFHHATIVRDLNILHDYMDEFVIPTTVLQSRRDADDYAILQPHLPNAEYLTGVNFPATQDDLHRIAQSNRAIIHKYRVSVDFFGNIGFQRSLFASLLRRKHMALMNNLLVVHDNGRPRIKIADTNLSELRFHYHPEVGLFQWLIDSLVFHTTRLLIHDNFGVVLL